MLHREIIAVCSQIHTNTHKYRGLKVEFWNVIPHQDEGGGGIAPYNLHPSIASAPRVSQSRSGRCGKTAPVWNWIWFSRRRRYWRAERLLAYRGLCSMDLVTSVFNANSVTWNSISFFWCGWARFWVRLVTAWFMRFVADMMLHWGIKLMLITTQQ